MNKSRIQTRERIMSRRMIMKNIKTRTDCEVQTRIRKFRPTKLVTSEDLSIQITDQSASIANKTELGMVTCHGAQVK